MSSWKLSNLFNQCRTAMLNMSKVPIKSAHCRRSKGNRLVRKARKYRRPEDLEDPLYHSVGPKKQIVSISQSIAARGFAREQPSYQPPDNVDEQLYSICKKTYGTELNKDWKNQQLNDQLLKYKVLTKSIETFKKNVPNSLLHKMKTVDDVVAYFNEPVEGKMHFDALVRDRNKLPPNFHLMADSPTFNPDSDSFFDGITAFPGRKRIIHTKTGDKFEKVIEWPHI